jgi:uncharacterized protein YecA (UPF0149 family)
LKYHELEGFLFAVAGAPELVKPSEWLPIVFEQQTRGFALKLRATTSDLMPLDHS